VENETIIKCSLRPILEEGEVGGKKEAPSTSICIFQILEDHKFKMIVEDDSYAGRPWGYFTQYLFLHYLILCRQICLEKSQRGYLVLCINFDRAQIGKFELVLRSSCPLPPPLSAHQNLNNKNIGKTIVNKWNTLNAGGCSSSPSFHLNPQYLLTVQEESEVTLELLSHDPSVPVGIVVFQTDGKLISQCDASVFSNVVSNRLFLPEFNSVHIKMNPLVKYNVVLSTYKPQIVQSLLLHLLDCVLRFDYFKQLQISVCRN
jgi:hypothetical protein